MACRARLREDAAAGCAVRSSLRLWGLAWAFGGACAVAPGVVEEDVEAPVAACSPAGPPLLHRLSRRQVGFAVSDLLGVDPRLSEALPLDLQDGGLAVTSAAQRLDAPWSAAALRVLAEAVSSAFDDAGVLVLPVDATSADAVDVALTHDEPMAVFTSPVTQGWDVSLEEGGWYDLDVIARMQMLFQEGDPLVDDDPEIRVRVDGIPLDPVALRNEGDDGLHHRVRISLSSGPHRVTADVVPSETRFASFASIQLIPSALDGPPRHSPVLDRWVTCSPRGDAACVRSVLGRFARVAWRGPVASDDLDALVGLVDPSGETDVYEGLATAFLAVLLDPRFLFLVEAPAVGGPRERAPNEVAARWATVLWESVPDEDVLDCADGSWATPGCTPDEVVGRMLADPRADRFLEQVVVGWMGLDALPVLEAQGAPLDPALRAAMVASAVQRLRRVLIEGGAWDTLIADPDTWLDPVLAAHHGLAEAPTGWRQVEGRGYGWLTDAATLTAHSQPARTSPTRRGRFLWERMRCLAVGERPAGVPSVDEASPGAGIEASLAAIAEDPSCASCHGHLDPLGLSLEGFDGVGKAREVPPLLRVWALEDGTQLGTPEAVSAWLREGDGFASCGASFLGTWLLQAVPDDAARCALGPLTGSTNGAAWFRAALRSDALAVRGEDAP